MAVIYALIHTVHYVSAFSAMPLARAGGGMFGHPGPFLIVTQQAVPQQAAQQSMPASKGTTALAPQQAVPQQAPQQAVPQQASQ